MTRRRALPSKPLPSGPPPMTDEQFEDALRFLERMVSLEGQRSWTNFAMRVRAMQERLGVLEQSGRRTQ